MASNVQTTFPEIPNARVAASILPVLTLEQKAMDGEYVIELYQGNYRYYLAQFGEQPAHMALATDRTERQGEIA